jgi:hypothetical protein
MRIKERILEILKILERHERDRQYDITRVLEALGECEGMADILSDYIYRGFETLDQELNELRSNIDQIFSDNIYIKEFIKRLDELSEELKAKLKDTREWALVVLGTIKDPSELCDTSSGIMTTLSNASKHASDFYELSSKIRALRSDFLRSGHTAFAGTSGMELKKKLEYILKYIESICEQTLKALEMLLGSIEKFEELSSKSLFQDIKRIEVVKGAIYELFSNQVGGGLYVGRIVDMLTGIGTSGNTDVESIVFDFTQCGGEKKPIPLSNIHRYPPLEPLHERVKGVRGRCVWIPDELLQPTQRSSRHVAQISKNVSMTDQLRWVRIIQVPLERNRFIWIKYGSDQLSSIYYRSRGDVARFEEELQRLEKTSRWHYRLDDLSYVWFCNIGRGMSTDPFDGDQCPFIDRCNIGKHMERLNRRCIYWSSSRRLFPRVYITPTVTVDMSKTSEVQEGSLGFFKVIWGRNVPVYVKYPRLQWYMPSDFGEGIAVRYDMKSPISRLILRTNVIVVELRFSLLEGIITDLLSDSVEPKPRLMVTSNKSVTLDDMLRSKYFIYIMSNRGANRFDLYRDASTSKLIDKYDEFRKKARLKDIVKYAVEVLTHTLAHMFYSYTLYSLELEPRDLLYHYRVSESEDRIMIAVIENNPLGSLDIIEHLVRKHGSIAQFVGNFLEHTLDLLEKHRKDIMSSVKSLSIPSSANNNILMKLNKSYETLVAKGLVLDHHNSILFFTVGKELTYKEKEMLSSYIHSIDILPCIDGCHGCVMLEGMCGDILIQDIGLSRNLAEWILRILLGREEFSGTGRNSGAAILRSASRSLIAISPYLDEDGLLLLEELHNKGIKVSLVTNRETYEKYREQLRKAVDSVCVAKEHFHYKEYLIDDNVLLSTSWNLSGFDSINKFELKVVEEDKAKHIEQIIISCEGR